MTGRMESRMPWAAAGSLCYRELIRFLRQRSRIAGALGAPLMFWFLIGSGAGSSFALSSGSEAMSYLEYFFPGTLVMILLFTAIFSTISIIEDRNEGFLQAVLAAPVPRTSIVVGKVAGGAILAVIHAVIFLLLAPLAGVPTSWTGVLLALPVMFLVAAGLTSLGFMLAWSMESIQGFHAIMNMALIPMWFLSGALFPPTGAAGWVKVLMYLDPLTYGLAAVRQTLYIGAGRPTFAALALPVNLAITVAVTICFCGLAVRQVRSRGLGDMQ